MTHNKRSEANVMNEPRNRETALDAKLGPFRSVCYDGLTARPIGGGVKVLPEVAIPSAVQRSPKSPQKVSAFVPLVRGIGGGSP